MLKEFNGEFIETLYSYVLAISYALNVIQQQVKKT